MPAEAVVDLDAITANAAVLRERLAGAQLMAVVKADGYGHGAVPAARAALAGGATRLGVAHVHEALALRRAGIGAPVLAWLLTPGLDLRAAVAADVELSVAAPWALEEVVAAARATGRTAGVHLELDTGMSRGGSSPAEWADLLGAVAARVAEGAVRVSGTWAHFASADAPGDASVDAQLEVFAAAVAAARARGLDPGLLHHANSAAALFAPRARFDLARCGIALYGVSPAPHVASSAELGLVPAMTLTARLAHVRAVPAGAGVSYGLTHVVPRSTTLGLVPVGYGDGLPRHASSHPGGAGAVLVGGRRRPVLGRVCMDQVVVDLGGERPAPGEPVVVFGAGAAAGRPAEPTAQDWAEAAGTIAYEVVTRIGPRVPRRWTGAAAGAAGGAVADGAGAAGGAA
ncbi:alanine racemase [Kineococcus indalonis]|uniref:alanine racemase n=1 Tax=Kineococcus indalonis TaxID=2696566 RepID=UPI001411F980|nr:alanine racemase [Kineococcus indalonis]